MNERPPPDPALDAMLTELAELGMRAARVLVRVMEAEQAGVVSAQGCLPEPGFEPPDVTAATSAGMGMDVANSALVAAVPRLEGLMRALDRVSRSVRRSVALRLRVQAGWPRAGSSDDRQAMVRRQVARGVGEAIARASANEGRSEGGSEGGGEAAERLFDELAERLDDPAMESALLALPVETVVRRICAELGLAAADMTSIDTERTPRSQKPGLSRGSGQSAALRDPDTC